MDKQMLRRLYNLNHRSVKGGLTEEENAELERLLVIAREQLERVEDDYAMYCLTERYINAKPWGRIADEMGQYGEDSVRKCCERAVKRYFC